MDQKTVRNLEVCITGKHLRYPWFWEKRIGGKRLYFIVDETMERFLLITFQPKKKQEHIIRFVIANKEELFRHLRGL